MRLAACLPLFLLLIGVSAQETAKSPNVLTWSQLAELPPNAGERIQPGVAGPFAGVHNDVLIVAGGANFPEGLPWNQLPDTRMPPKVYHDTIFFLTSPDGKWRQASSVLPQAAAYGVSIATAEGVLCIAGEYKEGNSGNAQTMQLVAGSVHLSYDPERDDIVVSESPVPDLPKGVTGAVGARIGKVVYLAGGDRGEKASKTFLSFDTSDQTATSWTTLDAWDGPARTLAVGAAQGGSFYLFSGRRPHADGVEFLTDGHRYDPKKNAWESLAPITRNGKPICLMAGAAAPFGHASILAFGGADGEQMAAILKAAARNDAAPLARQDATLAELNRLRDSEHQGFSREVLSYNIITRTWDIAGTMPSAPVTTTAVRWGDGVVLPSGESKPGVRTTSVLHGVPAPRKGFGKLNYAVLLGYLAFILLNGLWFSRRMKTTDDFFKAGGRIPWWAAGISIFGTLLSAITFIAIPASVYATDWRNFIGQLSIVAVAPFIVLFFLPFYRRLNLTTAYTYLERRFSRPIRQLGSGIFMVLQFNSIAARLFLPALALSVATGMNVYHCVLLMGIVCIVYTSLGGMEAVIWTDIVQVVILVGGALLALFLIPGHVDGGLSAMLDQGFAQDKFRMIDLRLNFGEATFLALFIGGFFGNIITYGTDQSVIQRYLTTRTEAEAARSIWTNAVLVIPASLIFFSIGTFLFLFYQTHPGAFDITMEKPNGIFPLFIVDHLPAGVAGLVIAAVFAASMSSIDSGMNAISAAATTDFLRTRRPNISETSALRFARVMVVLAGLLGTSIALWMASMDIPDLWNFFMKIIGLFGGGLGGVFVLGMFTRRANTLGAFCGLLASFALQAWLSFAEPVAIHPWMFAVTGMLSCIVVGYLVSMFAGGSGRGPTIHDMRAQKGAART